MLQRKSLVVLTFGLLLSVGCSIRKNPTPPSLPAAGKIEITTQTFTGTLDAFSNALITAIRPDPTARTVAVYTPPGHRIRGQGRPFPTLYLLHDFGGTETYYGFFEFARLLDRLIASGEIQPMIVVQTDFSNFYGGSFYTDSPGSARYFTLIDSLVSYVDRTYNTVGGRRARALAGLGMGGYGALKYVLSGSDTTFGSVSALSAPLGFDGGGTGRGFLDTTYRYAIFNEVKFSNGTPRIPRGDSARYDSVRLRQLDPTDTVHFPDRFQASLLHTNLIFAMAAAFSPVDTTFDGVVDSLSTSQQRSTPNFFKVSRASRDAGVFYPFDHRGDTISPVWQHWRRHDLTLLLPTQSGRLDSTPVQISCGLDDQLGMLDQTRAFRTALFAAGFDTTDFTGKTRPQFLKKFFYEEYSGYPGRPADHTGFVSDQLVKVFKFHSQFLEPARVP
jgi:S-formylglutathione hydrolase FrmB